MRYVLGIDSGGTKYLVRAAALDGAPLGEYRGQTCSHYQLSAKEAAQRIDGHLSACLERFGGRREECERIVCGTTGYDSPEDGSLLHAMYAGLKGFQCAVCCVNDVELAHYIAVGGTGALVLAGTGSIAYGRNAGGKSCRVGGWPRSILGEEGSGRYIDLCALRHYSRYLDGCRPRTPLTDAVEAAIGSTTRKGLMDYAMRMMSPPWPMPGLGKAVDCAAQGGDPYAADILRQGGVELFRLAEELIHCLGMEEERPLPIGVWGSVLMHNTLVFQSFQDCVLARYPQARILRPTVDAAQGAVEIALRWHAHGGDCRRLMQTR